MSLPNADDQLQNPDAFSDARISADPARAKPRAGFDRLPMLPVLAIFALGILLDRVSDVGRWGLPLALAALVGRLWAGNRQFTIASGILLAIAGVSSGAMWHHVRLNWHPANSLGELVDTHWRPVRLVARVESLVGKRVRPSRQPTGEQIRSMFLVQAVAIRADQNQPISGRCRVTVEGDAGDLQIGDELIILGQIAVPKPPGNPGEFDYARFLREESIAALVRVETPHAIQRIDRSPTWLERVLSLRHRLRRTLEHRIKDSLGDEVGDLGVALLLGQTGPWDHNVRQAFARSGTLHVMAISGVNVGLLWTWCWVVLRLFRLSSRTTLIISLTVLIGYAFLTDGNPPVVRATFFAALMIVAQLRFVVTHPVNLLATAAMGTLLINPADLFQLGAQLSFLSVATIYVSLSWFSDWRSRFANDPVEKVKRLNWFYDVRSQLGELIGGSALTGGLVWFVTTPLVVWQFHLVSPLGLLVNLLLSPLVAILMWSGYAFLAVILILPQAGSLAAWPFRVALQLLWGSVSRSVAGEWGYFYLQDISPVWVGLFYVAMALGWWIPWRTHQRMWRCLPIMWTAIGIACLCFPRTPDQLTVRTIDVGHGLSVLVEVPGGPTLLYDAGAMGDAPRTADQILRTIWHQGRNKLDFLVLSHADADHLNAVPELLESMAVGELICGQSLVDSQQPTVRAVFEAALRYGVPVRVVHGGDRVELGPLCSGTVLHPAPGFRAARDNANSLVMEIAFAGKTLLLTGDLEKEGLAQMLNGPRRDVSILISPHHGSKGANTLELAAWCRPEFVAASCQDRRLEESLARIFPGAAAVDATSIKGQVIYRITPSGQIERTVWRKSMDRASDAESEASID